MRRTTELRVVSLMLLCCCCSNSQVVAELLRRADGALEVVDASGILPSLVRREGLRTWQVAYQSRDVKRSGMTWFSDYDSIPDNLRGDRIPKSMFPPELGSVESEALRHCMRLFPTDQNTGGFFVTLLRKKCDLPGELQKGLPSFEDAARQAKRAAKQALVDAAGGEVAPKTRRWPISEKAQRRIDAAALKAEQPEGDSVAMHQYSKLSAEHWNHIHAFYGIKDHFPHVRDRL